MHYIFVWIFLCDCRHMCPVQALLDWSWQLARTARRLAARSGSTRYGTVAASFLLCAVYGNWWLSQLMMPAQAVLPCGLWQVSEAGFYRTGQGCQMAVRSWEFRLD